MINIYQMGGVVFTPPIPNQGAGEADTKKAGKEEKKKEFFTPDDLKELSGKGLANDMTKFVNEINNVYEQYENLSDIEKAGPHGRALASMLRGSRAEINAIERRQKQWENSYNLAKENKALTADAVTDGGFIVKKGDNIYQVSFEQYASDKAEGTIDYNILNVSQLAKERDLNPSLTDNVDAFDLIASVKGPQAVYEELMKVINNATGSNAEHQIQGGYLSRRDAMAVDELIGGVQGGVYESYQEIKQSSNADQLMAGLSTIRNNLDQSSLRTIIAQAFRNGANINNIDDKINEYLLSLISPKLKTDNLQTNKVKMNTDISGIGGGGSEKVEDVGTYQMTYNGMGDMESMAFMSHGSAKISSMGSLLPTKATTTETGMPTTLEKTDLRKLGDLNQAFTYDGERVDKERTIMTGRTYYTKMPVLRTPDGGYKIDTVNTKVLEEYNAELKKAGLNKPDKEMSKAELETKRAIDLKYKIHQRGLEFMDMIVGEAISYDRQGSSIYFWNDRKNKPDIYRKTTKEELRKLEKATPDDDISKDWIDDTAWSHLVFIPAQGEAQWRDADGNQLKTNRENTIATNFASSPGARRIGQTKRESLINF